MSVVRIGPLDRRAGGRVLQGPLLRLRRQLSIPLIEVAARRAAEERAADDGARDGRPAAAAMRPPNAPPPRAPTVVLGLASIVAHPVSPMTTSMTTAAARTTDLDMTCPPERA